MTIFEIIGNMINPYLSFIGYKTQKEEEEIKKNKNKELQYQIKKMREKQKVAEKSVLEDEEAMKTKYCPVIKKNCLGSGCMSYRAGWHKESDYYYSYDVYLPSCENGNVIKKTEIINTVSTCSSADYPFI